jgi:hypothetical protein
MSEVHCYQTGNVVKKSVSGPVYSLGLVGAAIFYIQQATGFWVGVLGILKAIVWPAILTYKLLEFLKG